MSSILLHFFLTATLALHFLQIETECLLPRPDLDKNAGSLPISYRTIWKGLQGITISFHVVITRAVILVRMIVHMNCNRLTLRKLFLLPKCFEQYFAVQKQQIIHHSTRYVEAIVTRM
ncbi:hypothetical protein M758_1G158700 [Ceratodon purpureus]|uniref:Secreted protein n=1 Tax=Ceratodon purpureus TaxID=3225 RepID=A0A8T0J7R1_CERPU|nr:hypothetical protein KC19_1G163000 [Ceratodon purpureus]KAG0630165.1 hypothetical protein M758_1G158700 [Ceratodon purpureus]